MTDTQEPDLGAFEPDQEGIRSSARKHTSTSRLSV